ncbi:unnamed protein product, partial [Brassica rapa]
ELLLTPPKVGVGVYSPVARLSGYLAFVCWLVCLCRRRVGVLWLEDLFEIFEASLQRRNVRLSLGFYGHEETFTSPVAALLSVAIPVAILIVSFLRVVASLLTLCRSVEMLCKPGGLVTIVAASAGFLVVVCCLVC